MRAIMPSMSKLEIKNLCFSYDQEHLVIDDISFKVEKGSFVCLLGHNGSGKSTLAKLIVGLLEKKSGQIFFDDEESAEIWERNYHFLVLT